MDEREKDFLALVARIIAFLRDHNQHCYTAEELAAKEKIKRGADVTTERMTEICELLSREGIIDPKREDKGRCYQAVRLA